VGNSWIVPYLIDVAPEGSPRFLHLTARTLRDAGNAYIIWDSLGANETAWPDIPLGSDDVRMVAGAPIAELASGDYVARDRPLLAAARWLPAGAQEFLSRWSRNPTIMNLFNVSEAPPIRGYRVRLYRKP
jgi:hypothetical protein